MNTGTGNGSLRLDVVTGGAILDGLGNAMSSGFSSGETYTIDKTKPEVSSIVRAGSDPTNAASVDFTVTFSEAVSGVGSADFIVTHPAVSPAIPSAVLGQTLETPAR